MNLPDWRKWLAVGALCLCKCYVLTLPKDWVVDNVQMQVGSISLAAEIAIAGLTPVFLLEYSGVADPADVLKHADLKNNPDPTALIPPGATGGVSLSQISLLATIPLLSNGFATYLLVPLSTAIGRRPVLILTSTLAWTSGFWAGASTSLYSHIGARVFHGLGSGAVEALIPLIIQDLVFLHQRNKAIAAIFAAQVRTCAPLEHCKPRKTKGQSTLEPTKSLPRLGNRIHTGGPIIFSGHLSLFLLSSSSHASHRRVKPLQCLAI